MQTVTRPYGRGEQIADRYVHLAGLAAGLAGSIVLVAAAAERARALMIVSVAVYGIGLVCMIGASALYNFAAPSRRKEWFRRLDHAAIFLMIAGTYTPICLALLDGSARTVVLIVVWVGALAGIVFRVVWLSAPPWLYTPFYVALGWVAVSVLPALARNGGAGTVALIIAGGLAYSVGGLVYALKRPDPAPATFGYHEIFHTCTLIGFACHYAAVVLAVS
jgi:hemolysin III